MSDDYPLDPAPAPDGRCPSCGGWSCAPGCEHEDDHDNYSDFEPPTDRDLEARERQAEQEEREP